MLLPLLRTSLAWPGDDESAAVRVVVPPVDVTQQRYQFVLLCDLPGVSHTNIKIELLDRASQHFLVISGTFSQAGEVPAGTQQQADDSDQQLLWLRRERPAPGPFRRMFVLPGDVDANKIRASIDKGVLKVLLPRRAPSTEQPHDTKTIPVSKL